ncbi:Ig-like domain-containing protein [Porticoccaceae bacterium]|nr:Ig-like domain-containing protein [Porticoccaceae bacterium]
MFRQLSVRHQLFLTLLLALFSHSTLASWTHPTTGVIYNLSTTSYAGVNGYNNLIADVAAGKHPWWSDASAAESCARAANPTSVNNGTGCAYSANAISGGVQNGGGQFYSYNFMVGWYSGGFNLGTSYSQTFITATPAAPPVPVISQLTDATNTGSTSDSITANGQPVITGSAQAGATVTLYLGGSELATVVADSSGNWSYTFASQSDGNLSVTATATDSNGTSAQSSPFIITIDSLDPSIGTIALADGSNSASTADLVTNDNTPQITGSAESLATVTVYAGSTVVATTSADAGGNWAVSSNLLSDGDVTLTAVAQDAAGNSSAPSNALALTIDTQIAIPSASLMGGLQTNDTTPMLSGSDAEPGATVEIRLDGTLQTTVTADSSGAWSYTPSSPLSDGDYSYTLKQTDIAGNASGEPGDAGTVSFTVDTVPPALGPVLLDSGSNSASSADLVTNDNTPTFIGTAEPNAQITVFAGTTTLGTTSADGSGNWLFTSSTITDAAYSITAIANDAAGNSSAPSSAIAVTIDTQVAVPLASLDEESPTNNPTPQLTGSSAEPQATIAISVDGSEVGTTLADANGDWSYTFNPALVEGSRAITLKQTDIAGNISTDSPTTTLLVDTTPPAKPVVDGLDSGSATGLVSSNITALSAPTVTGTAEANATVTLSLDGVEIAEVIADSSGNWHYAFSEELSDGDYLITVVATDAAGNPSANSEQFTLIVDTTQPGVTIVGPQEVQVGPFNVAINFTETVYGFELADIAITNGTVTELTGGPGEYTALITPEMGQVVAISIPAAVASDDASNVNLASNQFSVLAGSPQYEFEQRKSEVRRIIRDQIGARLVGRLNRNQQMMTESRHAGITAIANGSNSCQPRSLTERITPQGYASKGSRGTQINANIDSTSDFCNGVNWRISGNLSVIDGPNQNDSKEYDLRLSREQLLAENHLLGFFLAVDSASATLTDTFTGEQDGKGVTLGGYWLSRVAEQIYLDGFVAATRERNKLSLRTALQNDHQLQLGSQFYADSWQSGLGITGVVEYQALQLRPNLSLAYGATRLGEIDFTADAYGLRDLVSLDAGVVEAAIAKLTPELLFTLPATDLKQSTTLSLAPSALCQHRSSQADSSQCGFGLGFGLSRSGRDGHLALKIDYEKVDDIQRVSSQISYTLNF